MRCLASLVTAALLSACFETEPDPAPLLLESRIAYRTVPASGCRPTEEVALHVPRSTRFDSLKLCVQSDQGRECEVFHRAFVKYVRDTVVLGFLLDSPRLDVSCSTWHGSRVREERLPLEVGGIKRDLALPESLAFHIGDKVLRYGYEPGIREYVSRQFAGKGITPASDYAFVHLHGMGLDSLVVAGRLPPRPLSAVLYKPPAGLMNGSSDTLPLDVARRVLPFPRLRSFELTFLPNPGDPGCGGLRFTASADTLVMLSYGEGAIRIPPQPGSSAIFCARPDHCQALP